jgi:hypothetical protein
MPQRRADFLLGMVAGTAFGLAVAMIFVDPGFITPDNIRARGIIAVGGLTVAAIIQGTFERLRRKSEKSGPAAP